MAWFNFNTFNHCRQGRIIVEDITRTMGLQMQALGHCVTWTDTLMSRAAEPHFPYRQIPVYNVLLESFADDPETLRIIASARARGCKFIYVATEEPSDAGFNHGLDPAMIDRQNAYAEAMKYAVGTLHLIPGQHVTDWYAQFGPAAYAELGWAPGLDCLDGVIPPVRAWPAQEMPGQPDHDVGFFGKMTWRRGQILDTMEAMGLKVLRLTGLETPRAERDAIMRRAKVIVQIRGNDEWTTVSSTRCVAALAMGRPVIAEPHPSPAPWDEIVGFSQTMEEFYAAAEAWSSYSPQLRDHLQRMQYSRFREKLTPEHCIGGALRTLGIA